MAMAYIKRVAEQFIMGRQTIVAYPVLMVSIAKLTYCNSIRSELVSLPTESIVQNLAERLDVGLGSLTWTAGRIPESLGYEIREVF